MWWVEREGLQGNACSWKGNDCCQSSSGRRLPHAAALHMLPPPHPIAATRQHAPPCHPPAGRQNRRTGSRTPWPRSPWPSLRTAEEGAAGIRQTGAVASVRRHQWEAAAARPARCAADVPLLPSQCCDSLLLPQPALRGSRKLWVSPQEHVQGSTSVQTQALPPTCFRSCSWRGWATRKREAPSLARAQVMAAPMPREAPVSRQRLPWSSDMVRWLCARGGGWGGSRGTLERSPRSKGAEWEAGGVRGPYNLGRSADVEQYSVLP